ncbi:MAG: chromosome partitioning protein ParB [Rhodospirillales bacterium 20-64-7]|nr:MAG: chromosome partitioning protein ParB [Rhodospirillales bacterium 20-64-7]
MSNIKIEMWDITKIVPYELNAKNHDPKQVEKIAKSITEFGWDQPIVVDKKGVIIKGHGRRLAALSLGKTEVPVLVRSDLTDEQVRAARLADNRVAISGIDIDMLQKELADLSMDLTGIFDAKELTFLNADLGEIADEAFSVNLDEEVERQSAETATKIKQTDERPVKIEKALGFKTIAGKDERAVARFMARIESETGLEGSLAFVDFVSKIMAAEVSQ